MTRYRLTYLTQVACWLTWGHRYLPLTGCPSLTQCVWCRRSKTLVQEKP